MRQLYTTRVVRPFPPIRTPRSYLNHTGVAWCPYHDLIAVISGCGAVAVFHPDSPANVALLTSTTRSPAKHVAWRKSLNYPPLLAVADESLSVTFWLSINRRVNEWHIADIVQTPSHALAIGWNSTGSALAASLSDGRLSAWSVPAYVSPEPQYYASAGRLQSEHSSTPKFPTSVRSLSFVSPFDTAQLFGGNLRCASIAPGHVDPNSIALVTVMSADPTSISVWQIFFNEGLTAFDVRRLATTTMQPSDAGACIACAIVPPSGMLFAISCRGIIARWRFLKARSGVERGWHLEQHARIHKEIKDAASRAPILKGASESTNSDESGKLVYHNPEIYAFQVSHDCESMIFATSAGVLLWDVESLKVCDGHRSDTVSCARSAASQHGPIWGLCFSPTASAVFAANSKGFANVFTILYPISQAVANAKASGTTIAASRLVDITHADGLHGGWDLLAPVSFEGPSAASAINDDLIYGIIRPLKPIPPSAERIQLAKAVLRNFLNVDDALAVAAENLLQVAIDAMDSSAILPVKASLSFNAKDIKSFSSSTLVSKAVERAISSVSSVSPHQVTSAPLADWVMTLCSVWLQRCAQILSSYDPKGGILKAPWVAVVSMIPHFEKNSNSGHGMVFDIALLRALRPASVAAVFLLDIQSHFIKRKEPVRYHRFSRNDAHCVLAAFWEVSYAWESACLPDKSKSRDSSKLYPSVQTDRMLNAAVVLGKHLIAANVLAEAKELRVHVAEEALGLRGATRGTGFIMSCMRSHHQASRGIKNMLSESCVESCKYDILTGRRLSSGNRLRRCVISGLLAVDFIENEVGGGNVPPWITKWNNKSPFGGQWAVVTSQRVETSDRVFSMPQFLPGSKLIHANFRRSGRVISQKTLMCDSQAQSDAIRTVQDVLSQSPVVSTMLSDPDTHRNDSMAHVPSSSAHLLTLSHNGLATKNNQQRALFYKSDASGRDQSASLISPPQTGNTSTGQRGRKRELSNNGSYIVPNKRSSRFDSNFEGAPAEKIITADVLRPPPVHSPRPEGALPTTNHGMPKFEVEEPYIRENRQSQMLMHTSPLDIRPSSSGGAIPPELSCNMSVPASHGSWAGLAPNQGLAASSTVTIPNPPEISKSGSNIPHVPTSEIPSYVNFLGNEAPLESSGMTKATDITDGSITENVSNVPTELKSGGRPDALHSGWKGASYSNSTDQAEMLRSTRHPHVMEKRPLKDGYSTDERLVAPHPGQTPHALMRLATQSLTTHGLPLKSEEVVVNTQPGPDSAKNWTNYKPLQIQRNNTLNPWHVETNAGETYVPAVGSHVPELSSIEHSYVHSPSNVSNAYQTVNLNIGGKFRGQHNASFEIVENLPSSARSNKTHVNIDNTYPVSDLEHSRNGRYSVNPFHSVQSEGLTSDWGEDDFKDSAPS